MRICKRMKKFCETLNSRNQVEKIMELKMKKKIEDKEDDKDEESNTQVISS